MCVCVCLCVCINAYIHIYTYIYIYINYIYIYIQACRYGSRGSRPATRVSVSASGSSGPLAELRDHAFGLRDLVRSSRDRHLRGGRGTKLLLISSAPRQANSLALSTSLRVRHFHGPLTITIDLSSPLPPHPHPSSSPSSPLQRSLP